MENLIIKIKDWWRGVPTLGGRSSQWAKVRKAFILKNPECAVCGKKGSFLKSNEVHHCIPFSQDKSLELEMKNLITVCREHHLFVGHLMSFRSFNKNVRIDSELWKTKIKNRP